MAGEFEHQFGCSGWFKTRDLVATKIGSGFLIALLGPRGTGKTQLAACIVRKTCRHLRSAYYIKAGDLFRELRESYSEDSEYSEADIVERYCRFKLLVIDEAHERGHSEFEGVALRQIIDKRYDSKLDTLLISNFDKQNFAETLGDSVVSRIHETGMAIECDWPSFRKAATR